MRTWERIYGVCILVVVFHLRRSYIRRMRNIVSQLYKNLLREREMDVIVKVHNITPLAPGSVRHGHTRLSEPDGSLLALHLYMIDLSLSLSLSLRQTHTHAFARGFFPSYYIYCVEYVPLIIFLSSVVVL